MAKKILFLPNIRSGWNVGSLMRTADGMGFDEVALCGFTPYPPHKEISKTALGADEYVQWRYFSNIEKAIDFYKSSKSFFLSLELIDDAVSLYETSIPVDRDIVLILGNEVEGVQSEVLSISDQVAYIPMQGKKHSLNVSIAGAISMWYISSSLSDTRV